MAIQLRRKLPEASSLFIYDIDHNTLERFIRSTVSLGNVFIASNAKEIAEKSVSLLTPWGVSI